MSLAQQRKETFLHELEIRKSGGLNGIPLYYTFPKLGSILKTIPRGYPILWTANSGIGKTQSWIGIFIYTIYKIKKEHPELNLKVKLVIALLEDTKEMLIDRLYSMLYYDMFGIVIDTDSLHSRSENLISQEVIDRFDAVQSEIEFILEDCEIVDSIYNPTGLYKWARTISSKYGSHKSKDMTFTDSSGKESIEKVYSHYEPHDENMQILMIVDNLNNLQQEMREGRLLTERETINMWTRNYCRLQITKHWKWSVINIIQQASDSEKQQFDYRGNSIVEKLKPSLDGLGNSKECQRDHFVVVGLFAPDRYGIEAYEGYNIAELGDNYRSLLILKSNISPTNIEVPFYFDGACSMLRELPKGSEIKVWDYPNIRELIETKWKQ